MMKRICFIVYLFLINLTGFAQSTPFILKGALKENRLHTYRHLVNNTIIKNLSFPLNDSTEELWQDAFWAMEVINYKSAFTNAKIHTAFSNIQQTSISFQRAILELACAGYPEEFEIPVRSLLSETTDLKIFAMCGTYILSGKKNAKEKKILESKTGERLSANPGNPLLEQLEYQIKNDTGIFIKKDFHSLFKTGFLRGNVIMFSLQRKNRNYPGIVIIRDSAGNFIKENEHIFSIPQLARSAANLPGYLTNGNTPEGIFRMDGFDTSSSSFIGPTTNIQLSMPYEYKASHFYNDTTLADNAWKIEQYENLLPSDLKSYYPLYQTYYAGKAGRTEIIAHGTTIDPTYYQNKPYYPFTPTQGCLSAKELWNDETGRLTESDQQKLVDAIIKAGGPYGYAIVINLDDQQKPVNPDEIVEFILQANQK